MPNGSIAFLIDANILVYAYDLASPEKRVRAVEALAALTKTERAAVSTQTLGEFFSAGTRKLRACLPAARARGAVEDYARTFHVFSVTPQIVLEAAIAAEERRMSFWDAQVWATAKLNQVPVVLSEDLQGWGFLEGVQFLDPLAESFDLSVLG